MGALALAVLLALAGCGAPVPDTGAGGGGGSTPVVTPSRIEPTMVRPSESPSKPVPLPTAMPGVTLHATLGSTGSELVADYTVKNASARDVVVVDRIPKSLGSSMIQSSDIDPAHAWVVMADRVVRVTKQAFPIAPNVRFIADPVIGGHVVKPGGSTTGVARAPLPPKLQVPGPEFEAPRTPVSPAAATWQFCVQVADVDDPRDVVPVSTVAHAPLLCTDAQPLG